jgi:serine/threonine-protein kinase
MTLDDPMIGRVVLGRYRIVRALAKGGMGVVYLARGEGASGFTKPFVVKRMASEITVDAAMLKLFVREARMMSRLRHPGLVQVVDFGREAGDYLMVLEYVQGFHLGQWHRYARLTSEPFPARVICHVLAKVLDALHYAHTLKDSDGTPMQVVHRDVTPSNILIDAEGIVKLADFGVARSDEHTENTEETTIKGKMPYLAPELFRLARPSPSTDCYSVAVVLHEILLGKNEFRGQDMAVTVSRVLDHEPTLVDAIRNDLPDGLAAVVARGLAKDPADRYPDAASFAQALRAVREWPEEQADHDLRARTQASFFSQDMADHLGVPTLGELESAWHDPPPEILAMDPYNSSAPPTKLERPAHLALAQRSSARVRLPWLLLGLLVVALAGGGIAWALLDGRPEPRPTFVVVQSSTPDASASTPSASDASSAVPVIDAASPAIDSGSATAGGSEPNPNPRPPEGQSTAGDVGRLTAAFHARRRDVHACFTRDGEGERGDAVTIRFTIDARGSVTSARIAPASFTSTPLGQCVLGVARTTQFPALGRALEFSIPVQIRQPGG